MKRREQQREAARAAWRAGYNSQCCRDEVAKESEPKANQTKPDIRLNAIGGPSLAMSWSAPITVDQLKAGKQENQPMAQAPKKKVPAWVGNSFIGIFYLTVASMFTTGCAAAYVVGMIAMGYFGVDEFNHLAAQIHHYRDTALIAAGGSSLAPILRYGVPALWNTFIGSIAASVSAKLNK